MLKELSKDKLDRFYCLVIGKSGVGKTSLLRSIPKDEKVCILSAESGLLSVRDLDIVGYEISSFEEMQEAYALLKKGTDFKWIFIDSLSEIADKCAEAFKAKYPSKSDTLKMWGDYTTSMIKMIKAFRDLTPYNVVFTCLEKVDTDDDGKRWYYPAMPGGSVKERLASFFDEVFYMVVNKESERVLITGVFEGYTAKDRSGKLERFEKAHLGEIRAKLLNDSLPVKGLVSPKPETPLKSQINEADSKSTDLRVVLEIPEEKMEIIYIDEVQREELQKIVKDLGLSSADAKKVLGKLGIPDSKHIQVTDYAEVVEELNKFSRER